MPLEKYFLMSLKDIFVAQFDASIKGVESLSSNSPMIYVTFITFIDNEKYPGFLGASADCLSKLHIKVKKTEIEFSEDNILLEKFLKEMTNLLIKQMRNYIAELDTRMITISGAHICKKKGDTSYGLTRNFLIDNEDMEMSY